MTSIMSDVTEDRFCPRCRSARLTPVSTTKGIEVDICPICSGIWLDPDEILLFSSRPREVNRLLQEAGEHPRKTNLRSPVADAVLYEIDYPGGAVILSRSA